MKLVLKVFITGSIALIMLITVLVTMNHHNNTYEKRVERIMPEIQEVVSQYLVYYQSNREIFNRFEDIVNSENIMYCNIRFERTAGVEHIVYSNEKIVEEPHGRIKTILPELFQAYSGELFEFSQKLLKPDEFPFLSILKDDEFLEFTCIPMINRELLGVSFVVAKNNISNYNGAEDLGDGWQISWYIMGLT